MRWSVFSLLLLWTLATSTSITSPSLAWAQPATATQSPAAPIATAPDQTLTHDGVTIRYRDVGSGTAVLLIHGYSASLESLMAFGGPLTSSSRVVALDVRGFGRSSKFGEPTRFGQQMVDDVTRVMDHLQIDRAHLVGHSMGALIAANVAARYPKRVLSATLVAGLFYADAATFAKEVSPWVADLESGRGLANFLQWLFPAMPPQMAAGAGAGSLKANDLPSLIAVMRSLPQLAIAGVRADVPLLVAVGTADPLHPLSAPFVKASVKARLLEIDKADHLNVLAQPALANAMREVQATAATAKTSGH